MFHRRDLASILLLSLLALQTAQANPTARIRYELAQPARVSLAIYNSDGQLVRELHRAEPRDAGPNEETWDGLDEHGALLPEGDYEWRLLETQGFQARFLNMLGITLASPPANNHYGNWVGDHLGAGALAVDTTGVYVGSLLTEALHKTFKGSFNGRERLWSQPQYYDGGRLTRIAAANGYMFMIQPNGKLRRLSANSGSLHATWDIELNDEPPSDVDAEGTNLVVCFPQNGIIQWRDMESGALLQTVNLPNASNLTVRDGSPECPILVQAGETIYSLTRTAPTPVAVLNNITSCGAIDADHSLGDIYILRSGHTVDRYNTNLIHQQTYGGQPRPLGPYNPNLFHSVTDIAARGSLGFYIAEPSFPPRRVALVSKNSGQVIQEKYGGMSFYVNVTTDPADPTMAWGCSPQGYLNQYQINYDTGDWQIIACYQPGAFADGLYPYHFGKWNLWRRNGKLYLLHSRIPAMLLVNEQTGELSPVSITGQAHNGPYSLNFSQNASGRDGYPSPWVAAVEAAGHTDLSQAPKYYSWADANGNGDFDVGEWSFFDNDGNFGYNGGGTFDTNLNYTFPVARKEVAYVRMPRVAWIGPTGEVPLWSWGAIQDGAARLPDLSSWHSPRSLCRDAENSIYAVIQSGIMIREHGQYEGGSWPYQSIRKARLVKWNATGQPQFSVSRQTKTSQEIGIGKLYYPMKVTTGPSNTIVICDQAHQPGVVWTQDGLYAGSLLDQRTDDDLSSTYYRATTDDSQNVHMVSLPDGRVIWFGAAIGMTPIYEITGWNNLKRQSGQVTRPAGTIGPSNTGTGLNATYFANAAGTVVAVERVDDEIHFDWKDDPPVAGAPTNNFFIRWDGYLEGVYSENHIFEVVKGSGNRVRLWIDNVLRLDNVDDSRPRFFLNLTAGHRHGIRIEYTKGAGTAQLEFYWWSRNKDKERIPTENLYTEPEDFARNNRFSPICINDGWIQTRFDGDTNQFYFFQTSTDLIRWRTLFTTNTSSGLFFHDHRPSPSDPIRFFRAVHP